MQKLFPSHFIEGDNCPACKEFSNKYADEKRNDKLRIIHVYNHLKVKIQEGAQWLSGRVIDLRPRGRGFKPHRIVVYEQDTLILA